MNKSLSTRFRQWLPATSARWAAPWAALPRTRQWWTDAGIAAVVIGVSLAGSYAARSWHPQSQQINLAGYLLIIVSGTSLVARRRYPVLVLGITLVTSQLSKRVGHADLNWLPLIMAFFATVQARRRAAAIGTLVIGFLASVWPPWLIGSRGHASAIFALTLLCGLLVLLIAAELMRAAAQRRVAAKSIREQELLRLASEERMRIARDLHDIVAHNISVINVQANTALHLADRRPERAREALSTINDVSKQALAELRSVLGVLRADGEAAPLMPTPGMRQLGTLVANMAAAGLAVELKSEGDPASLPASVDLAAYRIIQEALTNSARHSGSTRATVRVCYNDGDVEIEVDDEGVTGPQPLRSTGSGSGIAGMTDRAQAVGGWLTAGPLPGGGFRVTALLPTGGSEA